jgi:membrane associated rhomboid family serine protease
VILPWLRGLLHRDLAPLTWTLVLLNLLFFLSSLQPSQHSSSHFSSDPEVLKVTAQLYAQFKGHSGALQSSERTHWEAEAFRDAAFLDQAETFPFHADPIVLREWRNGLREFQKEMQERPLHHYGVLSGESRPLTWVTYQFLHVGWMHLLSNMLLLILFGGAVELAWGSMTLVLVYLLSGVAGALTFLWWGQSSLAPMIGASGSVSGLMAFYVLQERRARIPYFYFLSPFAGYCGRIYLSKWLIFPFYFVADLTSLLQTNSDLPTGIASTAHVGGALCGIALALGAQWVTRFHPVLRERNDLTFRS